VNILDLLKGGVSLVEVWRCDGETKSGILTIVLNCVTGKPGLKANLQFTNNESRVFEEKEIRFVIHQRKKKSGKVNPSKHYYRPSSEKKCLPFKGEFRSST
jgi:hypothetical protein